MKPELRAVISDIARVDFDWMKPGSFDGLDSDEIARYAKQAEAAFLAALNWIESEYGEIWLAIGPLKVGFVAGNRGYNSRQFEWALWGIALDFAETEVEARAALMSACKEQISQWFKEQGE